MIHRDTSRDAEIIAAYKSGMTIAQVAAKVGCCYGTASKCLVRNRVKLRRRSTALRTPAAVEDRIIELCRAGKSAQEISGLIGLSHQTVWKILNRRGAWDARQVRRLLTDKHIWDMRVVALACRNWSKLGRMFGVSAETAKHVVLRKTYKHVPSPKWVGLAPANDVPKDIGMVVRTRPQDTEVRALYVIAKMSLRDIAKKKGMTVGQVMRALRREHVQLRPKSCRHDLSYKRCSLVA